MDCNSVFLGLVSRFTGLFIFYICLHSEITFLSLEKDKKTGILYIYFLKKIVFSLLHAKVQERPLVLWFVYIHPCAFNFLYSPDFCYISFDLFQLGPLIEINYIFRFHFGPPFNFRIEFKYLNIFGT